MYSYDIFEFIGNVGVIILISAYFFNTLGKIKKQSNYLILNIIAASLLLINLLVHINISGIVIEAFWIMISFFGLFKELKKELKKN